MKGIFNHMRCVDLLQSLPEVDPGRIGAIGHSLGGHNAMFVGVFDTRISVVVSSCGWTPFHDYYGGKIAGWTSDRYMPLLKTRYNLDPDRVPFDFYEVVAALAPRAFFSSSPLRDSNFDVRGVKKAIPKAREIYKLLGQADALQLRTPDCEHDFPAETRNEAYRIIDRALGQAEN
jgi:predicted dienelactone hydrolase